MRPDRRLRLLVVRQDNRLGNLILMIPFLRALRAALPDAEIALLSGEAYADLVSSFPWVDRWIVQEKRQHALRPWLFPRWIQGLRATGWDAAFEMSNHNTHSYYNCVLTVASGAPIRIGFDEPRNANSLTHPIAPPDSRIPFSLAPLEMLRAAGLPAQAEPPVLRPTAPRSARLEAFLREVVAGAEYAVVHVGGRGGKAWPLEAWTRLVPKLRELGSPRIVLIGGPDEIDRMTELRRRNDETTTAAFRGRGDATEWDDQAGKPGEIVAPLFGLSDLAHLLAGAVYYLGCDTGVMHLSAAVGTPTVALFFRSNPLQYAPLGPAHRTVLLADPYDAGGRSWDVPFPGLVRSPLFRVPTDAESSAAGIPVVDATADRSILDAVARVLEDRSSEPRGG